MIKSESNNHILEFNPKSHRYKLDGKPLPGVTTINRAFPQPEALIKWKINQGISEYISGEKLQRAANIGGMIHGYIQAQEKGESPDVPKGETKEDQDKIDNCISLFGMWKEKNKDEILLSEEIICSPAYRYAGTIDRLAKRNGKVVLSDFKTASGIYVESLLQVAGYKVALKEWKDIDVDVLEIIRFGKEDAFFETREINDPQEIKSLEDQFIRNVLTYRFQAKWN